MDLFYVCVLILFDIFIEISIVIEMFYGLWFLGKLLFDEIYGLFLFWGCFRVYDLSIVI